MAALVLACLFGDNDSVLDDEITTNDIGYDSPVKTLSPKPSFGCLSYSKSYSPTDKVQPLSNDAILRSLENVVPEYLANIASPPPSSFTGASSEKQMRKQIKAFNLKRTSALQKLHELTTKSLEHNRIPLVQTDKWNIVSALSMTLIESCQNGAGPNNKNLDENRRLICWTMNNLSIPYENKAKMILDDKCTILQALTMVIRLDLPEAYIACICINNLTFLAGAIRPVTFFVPPVDDDDSYHFKTNGLRTLSATKSEEKMKKFEAVLGNPSSLICTIERMMVNNAPYLLSDVKSVQGEAIRWACGFIRNVTSGGDKQLNSSVISTTSPRGRKGSISNESIQDICLLISRTKIPKMVVKFLRDSPNAPVRWTRDSLEDLCLCIMCNIARFSSRESLLHAGAIECLEQIEALPGIHGYRARAILVSLET